MVCSVIDPNLPVLLTKRHELDFEQLACDGLRADILGNLFHCQINIFSAQPLAWIRIEAVRDDA